MAERKLNMERSVIDEIGDLKLTEVSKDARILIATPNYTNLWQVEVHTNHIECIASWKKWGLNVMQTIVGRTFVHFARSQMCDISVRGDYTHIFWLDDDAVIDPIILPKFLEAQKDVVIAPYPMRRPTYEIGVLRSTGYKCTKCDHYSYHILDYATGEPVVLDSLGKTRGDEEEAGPVGCPVNDDEVSCPKCGAGPEDMWRDFHNHKAYKNLSLFHNCDRGLMDVDGGGTHCMLVNTDVFHRRGEEGGPSSMPLEVQDIVDVLKENLDEDGLERYSHFLGDLPDETTTFVEEDQGGKPYFLMPKRGTEDMYWCYRAKRKNIEILCDTDVFAGHLGFAPVITKGYREQVEKEGHHIKDKQYVGGKDEPDDSVNADGKEKGIKLTKVKEDVLSIRKPGIHQDKAANLV